MKLSDNLKRIRKENNLSQEQLAEKLGVSRQAVSKWESGQSYPEMDKVLLICKIFNYNIDELMNENIKEVDETKESKNNINKYIDDFFDFITKTIDMFSSMKFKQKLKCLTEQCIVACVLFMIFLIIGAIGSQVVYGIFGSFELETFWVIRNILESIYIVFVLILGIIIFLHIFKIRYLDYYEIVKEEKISKEEMEDKVEEKVFIEKKKEKIIIRDPEHSQSKFLNGIFRIILCFIKFMALCFAIGFVFMFVSLIILLVLSFLFVKTGVIFVGAFLSILSSIILNFIVLELFYNFIVSRKSKKNKMAIFTIISLILAGIGIGLILIGITEFNYIEDLNVNNKIEEVFEFKMQDNLTIYSWNASIEFVEEDLNDNIKVVAKHSKYIETIIDDSSNEIEIYFSQDEEKIMEMIRTYIDDINKKEIKDYYMPTVYVYASNENIEKLKQNLETRKNHENAIQEMENEILNLENEIEEKNYEINSLKEELNSYKY